MTTNLAAEADRLALSELHDLLDCVQSDLSVKTDELDEIFPQGTLGQTLKELMVEYVRLRKIDLLNQ